MRVPPWPLKTAAAVVDSVEKTAVIISAGTELTEGIIQDAHVRYIASELTSLGFNVLPRSAGA